MFARLGKLLNLIGKKEEALTALNLIFKNFS